MSENETPTLKAFSLLECLAASDHAMSLTELARIMDLPKPSIHRHLAALEAGGLIIRDAGSPVIIAANAIPRVLRRSIRYNRAFYI